MLGLPAKCSFVASCFVCGALCMNSQPSAMHRHLFRQSVAASSHVTLYLIDICQHLHGEARKTFRNGRAYRQILKAYST